MLLGLGLERVNPENIEILAIIPVCNTKVFGIRQESVPKQIHHI
jgi:hypothetical protein